MYPQAQSATAIHKQKKKKKNFNLKHIEISAITLMELRTVIEWRL